MAEQDMSYDALSTREITPRLRVELNDGFVEIVGETKGVLVLHAELPALISALQDISADLAGHS